MAHANLLISGLKRVILPSQNIHIARSCHYCTNKVLKETKVRYVVQ